MPGFPPFRPYEPMPVLANGDFRLITGRNALHTHVSTQNNPYLNELMSENVLWINSQARGGLGHQERGSGDGGLHARVPAQIKAFVTDFIHPEAVFMLHGFGHEDKLAARSYNKGVSDALLQANITDMVGGSPALHDTIVTVKLV